MNFIPLNGWPQLKDIPEKLEHFREVYARFAKVNRWYQSIEETELTGNPVIFNSALKLNATALSVDMLPIQSGSGDPSPTNIRPISGRSTVNLGRTGKNLWSFGDLTENLIGVSYSLKAGTYTISVTPSSDSVLIGLRFFYADDTNVVVEVRSSNDFKNTFTILQDVVKINAAITNGTATDVQLESGSDKTSFAPYITPVTITIALGQTVYGVNLDVINGVLTITHVYTTITEFTGKSGSTTNNAFYKTIADIKRIQGTEMPNIYSDKYKAMPYNTVTAGDISDGIGVNQFGNVVVGFGLSSEIDTLEKANTWATANPIQIAYELATPTTVQLTGEELEMLKGNNYISTDADSLTVKAYTI